MKILLALCLMAIVSGCATCREHPVACAIGSAIIIGSVAAAVDHHNGHHESFDPNCARGVIGSANNPACHR